MHICYWKYISILLLVLTFSNASAEKNVKMEKLEEWRENEWILESIIQDTVHASVNGKITHGDRLRIRFKKGNCDLPNMLASFYTTTIPLGETVLEGKIIDAKFLNYPMKVKVIHEMPFLLGKTLLIDLGFLPMDRLRTFFGDANEVTLKIEGNSSFQVKEYFNADFNTWALFKFKEYIDKAKKVGEELG